MGGGGGVGGVGGRGEWKRGVKRPSALIHY